MSKMEAISNLKHEDEEPCYFCKGYTEQSILINGKWLDLCGHCYQVIKGFMD